jgi:uncharacterized membrane protein YjgN (DUF898 family)
MTLAKKGLRLLLTAAVVLAWIIAATVVTSFVFVLILDGADAFLMWAIAAGAALLIGALLFIVVWLIWLRKRANAAQKKSVELSLALLPLCIVGGLWGAGPWLNTLGDNAPAAAAMLAAFAAYFSIIAAIEGIVNRRRDLPTPAANAARFSFRGSASEYFRIWTVNLLLTVITLGIYSAWAKVRARRYFYGNTYLGDDNFEYHANPKSILAARIIALAVYGLLGTAFLQWLFDIHPLTFFLHNSFRWWLTLALLVFCAWALTRGAAFNARNSSFCGVRFSFRKNYRLPLYPLLLLLAVIYISAWGAIILVIHGLDRDSLLPFNFRHQIGSAEVYGFWRIWYPIVILKAPDIAAVLLVPALFYWLAKWRAQNHSLGANVRFDFRNSLGKFYFYFLVIPLPIFLPVVWRLLFPFYGGDPLGVFAPGERIPFISSPAAIYLFALVYALYANAMLVKLFYGGLSFTGGRFRCDFSAGDYGFKIMLPNLILSVASLGLLIPWARVRRAKYLARHVWIEADEKVFAALKDNRKKDKTGALGDAAGDISGFDFDIALV